MVIWKGHGFLIAVFGILGALILGGAAGYWHAASRAELLSFLVAPAGAWGAALAIWLYGKTIGRPKKRMYLDKATQRPVVEHVSHALFFLPPPRWTMLAAVSACVVTVFSFGGPVRDFIGKSQMASGSPAKAAYTLAPAASEVTLPTPVRDWKDPTGRVMSASFEGFTTSSKDTGRFKRSDGMVFDVPFSRLCVEDQAIIRNIAEQITP